MAIGARAIWEFADALKQSFSTPSDTRAATVQSVDNDGTVWVVYPGASSPTPIASVGAAVEPGDYVYTQLLNGRLVLTTNKSDPAIGGTKTRAIVDSITKPINRAVVIAKSIADEAKAVANAINQHFWTDDNGAHVTDVTQDEWKAAVDDGFSDLSDTKPYYNQLSNSLGILLRSAINNLASWTRSAIAFYDGEGNEAGNIVASFGRDGAQIGRADESRMEIDYHSIRMVDKYDVEYLHVSDLLDRDGYITNTFSADGETTRFLLTTRAENPAVFTEVYVNDSVVTSGITKNALSVFFDTAPANGATVKIRYIPLLEEYSEAKAFTFGLKPAGNNRIGLLSFRAGYHNIASGYASHAEGYDTGASNRASHSEGENTTAAGWASHAEGYDTVAWPYGSHAQNIGTHAMSIGQTAIGKYNLEDTNDEYALIIGNGTDDANRSNALAVTWDGDIETPGGSITPVVLYDNDSTALNVPITLSETAANFRRLTICYKTNDNDYASVEVWHPDGKTVSLTASRTAGNSTTPTLWVKSKTVLISGTTINTTTSGANYYLTSQTRADGNQAATNGDYIAVTQVIGYR